MSRSPDGPALGRRPTAIDLFAGAGGTTYGLEWAGFNVRVAVDDDPAKAETLELNHPHTVVLGSVQGEGDVRNLTGRYLERIAGLEPKTLDLLVGCPPCQGYSIQGNRDPDDPRNLLFLEFVRLARELSPRFLVFENVPGIASLEGGAFLGELLHQIDRFGYDFDVWRLTASHHGVPQERERIVVIADSEGEPPAPLTRGRTVSVLEAIADLPTTPLDPDRLESSSLRYPKKPAGAYARLMRGRSASVTGCELTRHSEDIVERFRSLGAGQMDPTTKHRRLDAGLPAVTLTAGTRSRTACRPVHPTEPRVLTVREAARLTSFPDSCIFPRVVSEAWCQIGNAVPPLMAEAVFEPLAVAALS